MTGGIAHARRLGHEPYDREAILRHLTVQMDGWRFAKRYDDSRMLTAVRATLDVLDCIEGATLAERWTRFEAGVWAQ